jgi:hypothetical protein
MKNQNIVNSSISNLPTTLSLRQQVNTLLQQLKCQIRAIEKTISKRSAPGRVIDALDEAWWLYDGLFYSATIYFGGDAYYSAADIREMLVSFPKEASVSIRRLKSQAAKPATAEDRILDTAIKALEREGLRTFFRFEENLEKAIDQAAASELERRFIKSDERNRRRRRALLKLRDSS